MRISRCDAVIVRISRPSIGPKKAVVDIGIDGLVPVWYNEYRPCSLDGVLHFVPEYDPGGMDIGLVFRSFIPRHLDD